MGAGSAAAAPVPLAECLGCPWPPSSMQLPEGCFFRARWCSRVDSAPYCTNAGTPGLIVGATVTCDNCTDNCPECPPPPVNCQQSLQVCFNQTVTVNLAPGISGGEGIKAELKAAIGISESKTVCATLQCGPPSLPGCQWVKFAAIMNVLYGVSYAIDHTYTRSGIIDAHYGMTCPPPYMGLVWSQPNCDPKTSTVTGNKAISSGCDTLDNGVCN